MRDRMPKPKPHVTSEFGSHVEYGAPINDSWITHTWDMWIAQVASSTLGCSIAIGVMYLLGVL